VPALVALSVVGLLHGPSRHVTPLGSADGIAFAYAPEGTSHIYVTSGSQLVQVTGGHGSDLAPAWSPDRRRIAFQSRRDGNWEIYVTSADGTDVRRLTDDDARDGEPAWSADGKRIAFVRDGHVYEMRSDGTGVHARGKDGEWPSSVDTTGSSSPRPAMAWGSTEPRRIDGPRGHPTASRSPTSAFPGAGTSASSNRNPERSVS
jgi:Tol biopolymer transport system component